MKFPKKILALTTTAFLITNLLSCEFITDMGKDDITTSDFLSNSSDPWILEAAREIPSYEEYVALLDKGITDENFVTYDMIASFGEFKSFFPEVNGYEIPSKINHYAYYFTNGAILLIDQLNSNHSIADEVASFEKHGIARISKEDQADDLRTSACIEGTSYFVDNDIVYYYIEGDLAMISWCYEGFNYVIQKSQLDVNISGTESIAPCFEQWRTWISLFLNKKSNDRAIEFFGMMLDGELPTIEEVFGNTTEPCEITWQKPEQVA